MRTLFALILAASPLVGQFYNLATDDSGERVWFSSALRLRGTQQNLLPKIFVADTAGNVKLVAEAASGDPYSNLSNPEVSGDGKTLAYRAAYSCMPEVNCRPIESSMSVVNGSRFPGIVHLSRSGRYAAREAYSYAGPTGQIEIIDVSAGKKQDVAVGNFQQIAGGGRQVTSSGSALAYSDTLWLFGFDGKAQLVPTANFTIPSPSPWFLVAARAAVSDAGDRIVYQSTSGCSLVQTTASDSAQLTTLFTSNLPCAMQSLSADGSIVLFVSAGNFDGSNSAALPQCWVVDTSSKAISAVTHDPAGIAEATLSGDGLQVWAVTLAGRLVRVTRSTGVTQEIIPQTTAVDQDVLSFPLSAAAGALVHLTGRGLAARSASSSLPLATAVGGVQVLANGQPLPLVSVSPSDIVFQVPWEMQGVHTLSLASTQSPLEDMLSRNLQIRSSQPAFWYTSDGLPLIAHQDFHGLVSPADPAHPDETLHLYLTGMGPVTPAAVTGAPAPTASLSTVIGPVFVFWAGDLPINFPAGPSVLFAGLAPGIVGLEQVDIQLPHQVPAQLSLTVQSGSASAFATFPVSR